MTDKVDYFANARESYAVANTPLFLLRKLRNDPNILEFSKTHNSDKLVKKIRSSLLRRPKNLDAAVRPYAYLAALLLKGDVVPIQKIGENDINNEYYPWFSYILQYIRDSTYQTNVSTSHFDLGEIQGPIVNTNTDIPTDINNYNVASLK